jgi:hypothetical protein
MEGVLLNDKSIDIPLPHHHDFSENTVSIQTANSIFNPIQQHESTSASVNTDEGGLNQAALDLENEPPMGRSLSEPGEEGKVEKKEELIGKGREGAKGKVPHAAIIEQNVVPEQTKSDPNEDWCSFCKATGELLCCERCPSAWHPYCLNPPLYELPTGSWLCPLCDESRTLLKPLLLSKNIQFKKTDPRKAEK